MANPERTVVVAMDGSDYSNYAFDCKYFIPNHCGDFTHACNCMCCVVRGLARYSRHFIYWFEGGFFLKQQIVNFYE